MIGDQRPGVHVPMTCSHEQKQNRALPPVAVDSLPSMRACYYQKKKKHACVRSIYQQRPRPRRKLLDETRFCRFQLAHAGLMNERTETGPRRTAQIQPARCPAKQAPCIAPDQTGRARSGWCDPEHEEEGGKASLPNPCVPGPVVLEWDGPATQVLFQCRGKLPCRW